MRYIDKDSNRIPTNYLSDVSSAHLDEVSLAGGAHSGENARALFESVKRLGSFSMLKQVLLEEQGYICCYCGCRIDNISGDKAIVEHLLPISGAGRNKLASYDNLLISCAGDRVFDAENRSYGADRLHCDAKKDAQVLALTPLTPNCDKQFRYTIDGHVSGLTPNASDAVTKLNLDCILLQRRRLAAMELFLRDINSLSDEDLNIIKSAYESKNADGKYEPYCTAVVRCIEEYLTTP